MSQIIQQMSIFDLDPKEREVRRISYNEARPFIMEVHYARRMPCVTHAFGLFINGVLCGVVTYGILASDNLCRGLAGEKNKYHVYELNRLVILPEYSGNNNASYLIAHSLKMMPNRSFIVSYADTAWTHVGYVYQATNWLYTGMSAKRTDTYQPSGLHPRAYDKDNHSEYRQTRSAKHRYVYLVGNKREKKEMRSELIYKVYDKYPKGDEIRYDINNPKAVEPIRIIKEDTKEVI